MYNVISPSITLKFQYYDPKPIDFFNQITKHKMASEKDWNRKLYVEANTRTLLVQLNIAEGLIGTGNLQGAINKANQIWEKIRDRNENVTKKLCRNILAEAYQREDNFDVGGAFTKENYRCYNNDLRTIICIMCQALHKNQVLNLRKYGNQAEDILINKTRKEKGDFVWQHFRCEIIDIINAAIQRKNINIPLSILYMALTIFHTFFPFIEQIVQPNFSVKLANVVDLSLQLSEDQQFTVNSKNPRIPSPADKFSHFKTTLNVIDLAHGNPDQYLQFKEQFNAADRFLTETQLIPSHSQPEDPDKIDVQQLDPYNWMSQGDNPWSDNNQPIPRKIG
jgi:hypothetical protein